MTTKITEQNISNIANFAVDWQSVVTADGSTNTTAVAGKGYFIDTTSATHTIVLPTSPSFGDTIIINDYASTFNTNNVTINPNGNKIEASTNNGLLSTNDQTHTLVYTDSTQGWKIVNQDTASGIQPQFISATGGTITQSGNFQIHTFTGDGCFAVSQLANPLGGPNTVDYLVVAGGGGGGNNNNFDRGGGGGGAGGYREAKTGNHGCHTASPLATSTGITLTATTYPITVGAGGNGGIVAPATDGTNGNNSIFSTITSTGGGFGQAGGPTAPAGGSGGSGGGGSAGGQQPSVGGAGNTPPTSPSQGFPGGSFPGGGCTGPGVGGTGGGGALNAGVNQGGLGQQTGGDGGKAANTDISGSTAYYSGGGGGGGGTASGGGPGGGGGRGGCSSPVYNTLPGGGDGSGPQPSSYAFLGNEVPGGAGGANTGFGGGGGTAFPSLGARGGGAGGKGVVIIRYKYQ